MLKSDYVRQSQQPVKKRIFANVEEVQGQISLLRAVSDDGAEFCREVERDSRETLFNDDSHAA